MGNVSYPPYKMDKGDKVPMNHPKIRQDANKAAQVKLFEQWVEDCKNPEVRGA